MSTNAGRIPTGYLCIVPIPAIQRGRPWHHMAQVEALAAAGLEELAHKLANREAGLARL